MNAHVPATDNPTRADLHARLSSYVIGPATAALSFEQRLARENRWPLAFAERVVSEYKRFCCLAVTAGHDVTPSDAVDQAWHLHLTYSRDYWQRFCPDILGCDLHHGPTAGGEVERSRYYDQYAETLNAYEDAFGKPPPPDIWPPAARRFNVDPLSFRVNPVDVMVLPRRWLIPLVCGAIVVLVLVAVLGAYFG